MGDATEVDARARVLDAGGAEDALARRLVLEKYQAAGAADLERWGRSALAVAFDLVGPSAGGAA